MNKQLFDSSGHLPPDTIQQISGGYMPADQKLAALEHLAGCPCCSLALSQALESGQLLSPSPGFAESTLKKLQKQRPAPSPRQSRRSFWAYTLRVTAAMCAALILTFHIHPFEEPGVSPAFPAFSLTDVITTGLKSLSEKLFNLEVVNHD